jgi:hypothetical protein
MTAKSAPLRLTPDELATLTEDARRAGESIGNYLRSRLGLPPLKRGAPAGSRNNPQGRPRRETLPVSPAEAE